ncbi:type VI secretion system baseplate subunit TssE [Ochrobactrum oryzae]|nr:type VI secretion system baseplate subunit TssE [Brucella oryzae]
MQHSGCLLTKPCLPLRALRKVIPHEENALYPSVLDRLIQPVIAMPSGTAIQDEVADDIRRNLIALFNTRRYPGFASVSGNDHIGALPLYGLPEMAAISVDDETACNSFLAMIKRQILIFEPRLRQVYVSLSDTKRISPRCLELIIEAELCCTPELQILAFRSVIDLSSRYIQLEEHYAERVSGVLS